jgi:hypothetical protein
MSTQTTYPRVSSVKPLSGKRLLVTFANGVKKIYACSALLAEEVFAPLKDDALFRCVRADPHGYGVMWNDEIDLAESELWINGKNVKDTVENR